MAEYTIAEITQGNVTVVISLNAQQEVEIGVKLNNLSKDDKKTIRKLFGGDWENLGDFNNFLTNHPEALPANFPTAKVQMAIKNIRYLKEIEAPIIGLISRIDSTILVNGSVIKGGMDSVYSHLKKEIDTHEEYTEIFDVLKKSYEKSAKNKPEIRSIDANASVVLEGFIPNKRISNVGDSVIEISVGASAGKDPIVLVPGESWMIPKDAKTLFLKNKLATDEAHYSIRMKGTV